MRYRAWRWLPIFALSSWLVPAWTAGIAEGIAQPADARGWVARIHAAASQRNYQGTIVFSAGGVMSSSRVAHFCVGDQSFERLEALDGRQQQVYRVNDAVHTLWPQSHLATIEKRTPLTFLPSTTQAVEPRALEQYELRPEGAERVAGRDALVFLLQPRDDLRYAQRLWADKVTGLMLRADVIGANRAVLESAEFSEVEIGVKPQMETLNQVARRLDGYRIVRPQQHPTQLAANGWDIERGVPGFRLVGCVNRVLESAGGDAQVLQAVFSDGLTHVSLFIEGYGSRPQFVDLSGQIGATGTLRQRRGEHWITVMGDVPAATLKAFADALVRRR
jgi:sigma-E factor negative regulatory protein RseB